MMMKANRPGLWLRHVVVLICLLLLNPGVASSQGKKPGDSRSTLIVIENPRILDPRLKEQGISPNSFSETLRFFLSADANMTAVLVGEKGVPRENPQLRLSSTIERLQDVSVWTGELARSNKLTERLGPVVILDDTGLRRGALSEISALIRAQVLGSASTGRSVTVAVNCFEQSGPFAGPVFQEIKMRLQARVGRVVGIHTLAASGDACAEVPPDPRTAIVKGKLEGSDKQVTIMPTLQWQGMSLPLTHYNDTLDAFLQDREEYAGLLARAIGAITIEYRKSDLESVSALPASSVKESVVQGRRFLAARSYLALPLLQRETNPDAELLYDLGRAYQEFGASQLAERTFRKSIQANPKYGPAHKELGAILFNQLKYEEASTHFEQAGNAPRAREQHATALFLLGKRLQARQKALEALAAGESSADLNLLLVRLDLSDGDFKSAIVRLNDSGNEQSSSAVLSLFKEAAIAAAGARDYATADKALAAVSSQAPDPEILMLRGRVALALAQQNKFAKESVKTAIQYFQEANAKRKTSVSNNFELSVVQLELAEAVFVGRDYPEAVRLADEFLRSKDAKKTSADNVSTYRYAPVAALISIAGRHLQGKLDEPRPHLQRSLSGQLEKPQLTLFIPQGGKSAPIEIALANWSFETIDKYACTVLKDPQRRTILALSTLVRTKVGEPAAKCS